MAPNPAPGSIAKPGSLTDRPARYARQRAGMALMRQLARRLDADGCTDAGDVVQEVAAWEIIGDRVDQAEQALLIAETIDELAEAISVPVDVLLDVIGDHARNHVPFASRPTHYTF